MATFEGLREVIAELKTQVELRSKQFALSEENCNKGREEIYNLKNAVALMDMEKKTLLDEKIELQMSVGKLTHQLEEMRLTFWEKVFLARVPVESVQKATMYADAASDTRLAERAITVDRFRKKR